LEEQNDELGGKIAKNDKITLQNQHYHRDMSRQSVSSQTKSVDAEGDFLHDDAYEEFSDETLLFAEALGTENIFIPYQDIPQGNKMYFLCHKVLNIAYFQT
jgi:hypothetical protein